MEKRRTNVLVAREIVKKITKKNLKKVIDKFKNPCYNLTVKRKKKGDKNEQFF